MAARGLRLAATLAVLAASACASPAPQPPPTRAPAPAPAPFVAPAPPAAAPQAAAPPADSCGASALQYLIGRPHTQIPVPLTPNRRRVMCSTCPATQEFNPYRQTIIYDTGSGLVSSVRCG